MTTTEARSQARRADPTPLERVPSARAYTAIRTLFGLIWAADAAFKWQSSFRVGFLGMVKDAGRGQPGWLHPWFSFWTQSIGHDPALFAVLIALAETAIAACLLLGLAQRACFAFGSVFSLLIWGVGEGFGGPYGPSATDIGCAVMYAVVFAALWAAVPRSIRAVAPGLDHRLDNVVGWRRLTFF